MDRRQLLKYLSSAALAGCSSMTAIEALAARLKIRGAAGEEDATVRPSAAPLPQAGGGPEGDYLVKMERFYEPHSDDLYATAREMPLLESCWLKLKQVSDLIGQGNFHIMGFDAFRKACSDRPADIGPLTPAELAYIEDLYYRDAKIYGFLGERVFKEITCEIAAKEAVQLENGQYLYKGGPVKLYEKLQKHIGSSLVMTSGIRSVTKQLHLFLNKAITNQGNLSLASRAIAPPGYSFHGCGDFDIGRGGWGARNFTKEFETTFEFKELYRLGYVKLRYPYGNMLGVRYEPWHVETKPLV